MSTVQYDSKLVKWLIKQGINLSSDEHEAYKLRSSGFMDLSVETWIEGPLLIMSVCHYGEQNGDLMCDPEIVLHIDRNTGIVTPASFRNDYVGKFTQSCKYIDGMLMKDEAQCADLNKFTDMWAKNLREQGHKLDA